MEHIGEELRIRRILKKLTQAEVGKLAGVTQITVSNIERGLRNPTPRTIARIRRAIDKLPAKEVETWYKKLIVERRNNRRKLRRTKNELHK